jgi:hypothetical protein
VLTGNPIRLLGQTANTRAGYASGNLAIALASIFAAAAKLLQQLRRNLRQI